MGAISDQSSDISDTIDLCGEEHSRYVDDLITHWDKQLICLSVYWANLEFFLLSLGSHL